MAHLVRRLVVAAVVLGLVAGQARAGNLIVNGGFETGNFSGWTTTPTSSGSNFFVDSRAPHTGSYDAFFGGCNSI